jgi:hypothetical protein
VMLPLLLIAFMEIRWYLDVRARWRPLLGALVIASIPIGAWIAARWRVDEWAFFKRVFFQDFVALSTTALDNQSGSPLFYLNILQKHHYEWILATAIVVMLFPPLSWSRLMTSLMFWKSANDRHALIGAWSVFAIAVPKVMQTKMPWYLNPFYPMFALGAGWLLSYGLSEAGGTGRRRAVLVAVIVGAALVAEIKLIYYSYAHRSLATSPQGIVLLEADRLRGATVFRTRWNHADAFVLKAMVRAEPAESLSVDDFARRGKTGDYFLTSRGVERSDVVPVCASGGFLLYQKR